MSSLWKWIWKHVKKIPVIGWLLAGLGLVAGGLLGRLRGRPSSSPEVARPAADPKEIEKAKDEIRKELVDEELAIDEDNDDLEDQWNDTYQ